MDGIKKLEKIIDINALIRWLIRKWKSGLLLFCVAVIIGSGMKIITGRITEKRAIPEEEIKEEEIKEEEIKEVEEYLEYDVYIENILGIINGLEEDIQNNLSMATYEKPTDKEIRELSDKISQLETYRSYYNKISETKNNLGNSLNEVQNTYLNELKGGEREKTDVNVIQERDIIADIKAGIKTGTLAGMIVVGLWLFVRMLVFGLNKKIKSKEDISAICGDISVIEGKRSLIKKQKVEIGDNLGVGKFLKEQEPDIINLGEKIVFDVENWNNKLAKSYDDKIKKDSKVVLITEIGVSLYMDIIRIKEEYGDRLIGCLCVR